MPAEAGVSMSRFVAACIDGLTVIGYIMVMLVLGMDGGLGVGWPGSLLAAFVFALIFLTSWWIKGLVLAGIVACAVLRWRLRDRLNPVQRAGISLAGAGVVAGLALVIREVLWRGLFL